MLYSLEQIVAALKAARTQKGLSQKALGVKVGLPQSHISRIEQGLVDLQTSSLIQLARTLDLELMLVPSKLVPTFQALQRVKKEKALEQVPMYRLDEDEDENNE